MAKKPFRKKAGEWFVLIVVVPLLFFALVEAILRISGINTDVVKSDKFKIGIPLWAFNDVNSPLAGDIYQQILENELPLKSAEWMKYFEEAKYVFYKMKPNISAWVTNSVNRREIARGIKVLFRSNSRGFRTGEFSREKPGNVYRIFFLGDSTTFGWGVNGEERFSDVLVSRLNAAQSRIRFEAVNLGIPGYSSYHGRAVFEHYVKDYAPDMVILAFCANDGRLVPRQVKAMLRQKPFFSGLKDFLGNFKTYRWMRKILLSLVNPYDRKMRKSSGREPRVPLVNQAEFSRNLEYIIAKGREMGFKTALLGLCCPIDYLAKMSAVARRSNVFMMDGMYVLLKNLETIRQRPDYQNQILFLENLFGKPVLERNPILLVTSDSCHPNMIGHRLIAETLIEKLFSDINGHQGLSVSPLE
jgi:lysophospholipase L1-like esterase